MPDSAITTVGFQFKLLKYVSVADYWIRHALLMIGDSTAGLRPSSEGMKYTLYALASCFLISLRSKLYNSFKCISIMLR